MGRSLCDNGPVMETSTHATDEPGHEGAVAHHAQEDHGDEHGHDDHAHEEGDFLGPIDVIAWGAGVVGVVLGLAVGLAFALSTSGLPA
jgi:hypothetical protein